MRRTDRTEKRDNYVPVFVAILVRRECLPFGKTLCSPRVVPTATSGYYPPKLATNLLRYCGPRSCPFPRTSRGCTLRIVFSYLPSFILFLYSSVLAFYPVPSPDLSFSFLRNFDYTLNTLYAAVNYRSSSFVSSFLLSTFCQSKKFRCS